MAQIDSHTHRLELFLSEIAKEADLNRKQYFIGGGFVFDIQLGRVTRSHQDIDVFVMEPDLNWWRDWFRLKGFSTQNGDLHHTPPKAFSVIEHHGARLADIYPIRLDKTGRIQYKDSHNVYQYWQDYSWSGTQVVPYKDYTIRIENPQDVARQKQEFADRINRSLSDFDRHDLGLLEDLLGFNSNS